MILQPSAICLTPPVSSLLLTVVGKLYSRGRWRCTTAPVDYINSAKFGQDESMTASVEGLKLP